ncbi:hypothetical protein EXIGLDRAFT_835686 [Exidia glandulosa HHB12029]|uniref:Uncharacterized protein n=1 Tax=Exidia glandulosa HHB12029 TaxID=1314781 RepID=A0A165IJV3_EXIGL|nr:hypothetical protein EXIGLDRAFT_835686 [Exidia glandulosa HHB12029]
MSTAMSESLQEHSHAPVDATEIALPPEDTVVATENTTQPVPFDLENAVPGSLAEELAIATARESSLVAQASVHVQDSTEATLVGHSELETHQHLATETLERVVGEEVKDLELEAAAPLDVVREILVTSTVEHELHDHTETGSKHPGDLLADLLEQRTQANISDESHSERVVEATTAVSQSTQETAVTAVDEATTVSTDATLHLVSESAADAHAAVDESAGSESASFPSDFGLAETPSAESRTGYIVVQADGTLHDDTVHTPSSPSSQATHTSYEDDEQDAAGLMNGQQAHSGFTSFDLAEHAAHFDRRADLAEAAYSYAISGMNPVGDRSSRDFEVYGFDDIDEQVPRDTNRSVPVPSFIPEHVIAIPEPQVTSSDVDFPVAPGVELVVTLAEDDTRAIQVHAPSVEVYPQFNLYPEATPAFPVPEVASVTRSERVLSTATVAVDSGVSQTVQTVMHTTEEQQLSTAAALFAAGVTAVTGASPEPPVPILDAAAALSDIELLQTPTHAPVPSATKEVRFAEPAPGIPIWGAAQSRSGSALQNMREMHTAVVSETAAVTVSSSESRSAPTTTGTDMIDFDEDSDSEHVTTSFGRKFSFAAGHDMLVDADDEEVVIVHGHATTDVSSSTHDASLGREHAETIVISTTRQADTTLADQHVLGENYTEAGATIRERSLRTVPSQATLVEGQWEASIAKHDEALVVTHHESVVDAHYDVDEEDEEEEEYVEVIRPAPPSGPVLRIFEEPLDGEFDEEEAEEVETEAEVIREHVVATLHGDYARVGSAQETQESYTTRSIAHIESVTTGRLAPSKGSHLSGVGATHAPSSFSCHCGVKQSASPNAPVPVAHSAPPLVSFSVSISSNISIERTIALALVDEQSCGNGGLEVVVWQIVDVPVGPFADVFEFSGTFGIVVQKCNSTYYAKSVNRIGALTRITNRGSTIVIHNPEYLCGDGSKQMRILNETDEPLDVSIGVVTCEKAFHPLLRHRELDCDEEILTSFSSLSLKMFFIPTDTKVCTFETGQFGAISLDALVSSKRNVVNIDLHESHGKFRALVQ